jgi:hypothetical protein
LLVHYKDKLNISYYYNITYRGVALIKIKDNFTKIEIRQEDAIKEINTYEYFKDFDKYLKVLTNIN